MNKKSKKKAIISVISVMMLIISLFATVVIASANNATASSTITIDAKTYEFSEDNGYNFSSASEVSSMSFGKKQLGSLSISGEITDTSSYRNKTAYGIGDNSQISFSYSYDGSLLTDNKDEWHLIDDTGTSVDGFNLSGSIGKGVMMVQKSSDGSTWVDAANPVVNFYSSNSSGKSNFYTTSGTDVAQGMFYRVIMAYKTTIRTSSGFVGIGQKWETKKHVEVYEFYLVVNSGTISVHNLATAESDLPEIEGYTPEIIKRAETLLDGSSTTKGFKIDKLNASYVVQVSKDGTAITNNAADGAEFTENGKYTVKTVTKLGKTITQTFYVFNGGEDKGYSTYFGSSLVSGNRIFRYGDYPTYAKNSSIVVNAVSDSIPNLTGTVTNLTTNEVITLTGGRERQEYVLSPGAYYAKFYNSTSEAGSVYLYTFYFNVIDEDSAPFVNYDNLMKAERLSDLSTKHYEVAYQTTAGGYIFVCFSLDSYDEAFNYAYEIEKRFIEQTDDGLYYKSRENPNLKVKYFDYVEMTDVLNYYARKNVEYNYFSAIDAFTYQTYENNLLQELESLSIRDSIKVFPSQAEKDKLLNRQPFINDFTFINVADYDVVSVSAYCYKNGQTYTIEFDKDISSQLTVSSKYRITEKNVYGDEVSYDVYYVNDNLTKSTWNVTLNGVSSVVSVSSDLTTNNKMTINADTISITSIENLLDPMAIVTIKAPEVYSFEIKCLVSELESFGLYKKGTYQLTFVDRVGNSYQLIINISGKARYDDVVTPSTMSYTTFYNAVYMNNRSNSEEIMFDASALKTAIERVVDRNQYTTASYTNYERYLKEAIAVYENQNATQEQINTATANLQEAYVSLVLSADKSVLLEELNKFEQANKGLYTSATYNAWQSAYNNGKSVYDAPSASYEDINSAVQSLKNAFAALALRGDKTELYAKMQEIKGIDCTLYTPQTVEALNNSYLSAQAIFDDIDASQQQIDSAIADLTAKKSALCFIADFDELLAIIEEVKTVDQNLYTPASIATLKEAYDTAVAVYKDRNSTQSTVNETKAALAQAKSALVTCGDSSELREKVSEISNVVHMIYTKDTIEPLIAVYNEALAMLDGRFAQSEIDEISTELTALHSNLVIRQDKKELYDYLSELADLDISEYSQDKQYAFVAAYNSAIEILNSLDSTEEQVSAAKQNVESAKDDLEAKKTGLKWWEIVLICIGSLILMGIAQAFLSEAVMSDYSAWMWIVSIVALLVLLIFFPLPWWAISLIELGVIAIMTIILAVVEEM